MKDLASKRQKNASVFKTVSRAIYDKKEFEELLDDIITLLHSLEILFPAPVQQERLVNEDLNIVNEAGERVDSPIKEAANEALVGHRYADIDIQGKAQMGDTFALGWEGKMAGGPNDYGGVIVGVGAKAHLGNSFGGKGIWNSD